MGTTCRLRALLGIALVSAVVLGDASAGAQPAGKGACFDAAEKAQLLRYHGDLVGARPQLIACASEECPAAVRHDCADWLAQVDAATPTVTIHARDARGRDVIGARVLIDGAVVAERLGGTAISANPGAHRIRLETPSGATYEEQVLLTEGRKERLIDATFSVELGPDGMPIAPGSPSSSAGPAGSATSPGEGGGAGGAGTGGSGGGRLLLVGGLGVIGAVGISLATYFEVAGQKEYNDLKNGCGTTRSCSQSGIDTSKQKLYVLAPVTFGVGVVALGAAAALFFFGRHDAAEHATSAGWSFGVTGAPGIGASGTLLLRY